MICRIIPRFDKPRCLYWRWYEVIQRRCVVHSVGYRKIAWLPDKPWPAMTSCQCQAISPHPKQLHPLARRTVPCRHQQWLRNKERKGNIKSLLLVSEMKENTPQFGYVYRKKSMINHEIWGYYTILSQNIPECTSCSIKRMFFPWQSCVQGMFKRPRVPMRCVQCHLQWPRSVQWLWHLRLWQRPGSKTDRSLGTRHVTGT